MEKLKDAKNIVRLYFSLSSIRVFGMSLIIATNIIFFKERGLDLFEINIVALVAVLTTLCFEIPTGAIADVYGRKISFVCSCFIVSLGLLVYAFSNSLFIFMVATSIAAVGYTLESGAFKAWLVDSLKHSLGWLGHPNLNNSSSYKHSLVIKETEAGQLPLLKEPLEALLASYEELESEFNEYLRTILIRERQVVYSASIIGALCGAYITDINSTLPWVLASIITAIVGILAGFFMKEEYFEKQKLSFSKGIKAMKATIKRSIYCIKNNNAVKFLFLLGLLQSITLQATAIHWQPYFSQFLQNDASLGYIWSGMSVATIIGASLSSRIFKKNNIHLDEKKSLILLLVMIGLGIFLSGFIVFLPITLLAFLFIYFAKGIFGVIEEAYLHDNILSNERATIISFMSMTYSAGSGVGLLLSGYIAEQYSVSIAWMLSGLVLIIFTLLFAKK